ncbi:MAG: hypothetical protein HFJ94_04840 [Muribaculaceae bacterium]|nr:hypothetical protein [Muribaculaceae bacterium]
MKKNRNTLSYSAIAALAIAALYISPLKAATGTLRNTTISTDSFESVLNSAADFSTFIADCCISFSDTLASLLQQILIP